MKKILEVMSKTQCGVLLRRCGRSLPLHFRVSHLDFLRPLLILFMLFFIGCSFFSKKDLSIKNYNTEEKVFKMFEQSNKKLDQGKYKDAIKGYQKVLAQKPTSDVEAVTYYNIAYAYESLNLCKGAIKNYKQAIHLIKNKKNRMFAQSFYRLSIAYNCVGQNDKAIVSLLSARKNANLLPVEIAKAEIPARLAAAYARNGNHKMSEKFFREAESGIRLVGKEYKDPYEKRDMLAKTLYFMGKLNVLDFKQVKAKDYLDSVNSLQGYLLQSAELDSPKWSPLASKEILKAYQLTWDFVENVEKNATNDFELDRKSTIKKRYFIVNKALDNIVKLKKSSFPQTKETKLIKNLNLNIKKEELKLRNYLVKNVDGNELTSEALKRTRIKRSGKTYNPNPKLEYNKSSSSKKKNKDPNL